MTSECNLSVFLMIILFQALVQGRGILILYRPKDITNDCINSYKLRYDLSFGMGMSDTITLVFRTIPDVDYECEVDVNTDGYQIVYVVLRYPNAIGYNCEMNFRAFHVMQKKECFPVCDLLADTNLFSNYWVIIKKGRFRFQYRSNSRVNSDMGAHLYQVTVTTARKKTKKLPCFKINETECFDRRYGEYYCMTSGIVCDGIKNCGVEDWYDERKSDCEIPIQHLGYSSIIAVLAILMSILLAASLILQRCLPQATSFFIFSSTCDNRLVLNPIFKKPEQSTYEANEGFQRRKSVTPADWSTSSESDPEEGDELKVRNMEKLSLKSNEEDLPAPSSKHTSIIKMMSSLLERRFRSVVGLPSRPFVPQGASDHRPSVRPSMVRPSMVRPSVVRPSVVRPSVVRPSTSLQK